MTGNIYDNREFEGYSQLGDSVQALGSAAKRSALLAVRERSRGPVTRKRGRR